MGCDIHVISEIRYPGQDWQVWQRSPDGEIEMECVGARNYQWFGILGGISRYPYDRPVAEYRGLPVDVSAEVKEYLDDGYHSHTWCSLIELEQSIDILKSESDWGVDDDFNVIDKPIGPIFYPNDVYKDDIDARPIRQAYEYLCAECDLLDIPKPEIRMIVAFDS